MSRTTALKIITRALEKALKQDSDNSPFTVSEFNIAMDEMNDLMSELANGFDIRIGYTEVNQTSDETNLPNYALGTVKNMLAVRLSNEFGRQPNSLLMAAANDSLNALLARLVQSPEVLFPDTLPTGDNCSYSRKFFNNDEQNELETDSGDNITTERNFNLTINTIPKDPDKLI